MRLVIGAAVVVLAMSAGLLWLFAFPGAPAGMQWPQHTMWGGGPTGRLSGTLVERDGCFFLRSNPGDLEYLVIWPMFASLSSETEGPVIRIDGESVRPGDAIVLTGGEYGHGPLPDAAQGALDVPCDGPYVITTGLSGT